MATETELDCGHPRDGREEIAYVTCGRIVCVEHSGPHSCRREKHGTIAATEARLRRGQRKPKEPREPKDTRGRT